MRKNYFAFVPVRIRLVIVLSFLIAAIIVGIAGRPSAILLLVSAILLLAGGWRITRMRSFVLLLILMPALVGLLLTHFDWHHPFLARYFAGLFSVIAVLLLVDGIRIEEWIEMVRGKEGGVAISGLGPLLIGTAVGTISLASNIREQRACRKLAKIHSWRAKPRASIFLDSVALPFYNAVESHEFIDEALHRWGAHDGATSETRIPAEMTFGNSNFTGRLCDVKDFPLFTEVMSGIQRSRPIEEPWAKMISQLAMPAQILDIGDPAGQFAKCLRGNGFAVNVLADQRAFGGLTTSGRGTEGEVNPTYSHIFLHHNTFLEAVNEMGAHEVLARLHELSSAGALVCFDYPATVLPKAEGTILRGPIDGVGEVEYLYRQHEQENGMHRARLEYTVRRGHESFYVRVPLRFAAPALADVVALADETGYSSRTCPMPGAFSFLAGEMVFVEMKKR